MGNFYLMVSVGVTTSTASITPAPNPANIILWLDNLPFSSASAILIFSKHKNLHPALLAVPLMQMYI